MALVRPSALPAGASANPSGAIIIDQGAAVEKVTPLQVVDAARPLASQAEAEEGTNNVKLVSPLRVKQALAAVEGQRPLPFVDFLSAGQKAAVLDGSIDEDLEPELQDAADEAVGANRALVFPYGSVTAYTWAPPANLTVLTAGRDTTFRQMDTSGSPQRFIEVQTDGVQLWPGGCATINGGMTAGGVNATAFNSGVRVHAPDGEEVNSFTCGDIYGVDIGGDVIETGSDATGYLGFCQMGAIYGNNVYRNIVSITSGDYGFIQAVIQQGGCGLLTFDAEPDPTSSPLIQWIIGQIVGRRTGYAGDAAASAGRIIVLQEYLDYDSWSNSTPAFDVGSVSEAEAPTLFKVASRYRNLEALLIGHSYFKGHSYGGRIDIGEGGGDSYSKRVRVDHQELHECADHASAIAALVTQKTKSTSIGYLLDNDKVSGANPTIVSGTASDSQITIEAGISTGKFCNGASGHLHVGKVDITGDSQNVFTSVVGQITLDGTTVSGAATVFQNCAKTPIVWNATIAGTAIIGGTTPNARYYRSTAQSVFYNDGWASPINAQTGTSYTLALGDDGRLVSLTNAGAITLTVPANATIAFPIGAKVDLLQGGAGAATVTAAVGVTLNARGGLVATNGQHAKVRVEKIAINTWAVDGDRA